MSTDRPGLLSLPPRPLSPGKAQPVPLGGGSAMVSARDLHPTVRRRFVIAARDPKSPEAVLCQAVSAMSWHRTAAHLPSTFACPRQSEAYLLATFARLRQSEPHLPTSFACSRQSEPHSPAIFACSRESEAHSSTIFACSRQSEPHSPASFACSRQGTVLN